MGDATTASHQRALTLARYLAGLPSDLRPEGIVFEDPS
jgi:hypothetical protein